MSENTINIFLLSMGLAQGLLIFILIYSRDTNKRSANLYLSLFILAIVYQTISKILGKTWYAHHFRFIYTVAYDLPYLYGPLIYLYVSRALRKENARFSDLLHLIPFTLAFLAVVFYAFTTIPVLSQATNIVHYLPFHAATQIGSLLLYYTLTIRLFRTPAVQIEKQDEKITWLRRFAHVTMPVCLFLSGCVLLMYGCFPTYEPLRFLFLVLPLLLYWISYQAIAYPQLFRQEARPGSAVKYRKTPIQDQEAARILQKLQTYLETSEPFLDPEISLDKVAADLGFPRNQLSQVINQQLSMSFFELIQDRRLERAKKLLRHPEKQHLTIAALAYEAGFNSISNFNEVFKKNTALTPKAYRKQFLLRTADQR